MPDADLADQVLAAVAQYPNGAVREMIASVVRVEHNHQVTNGTVALTLRNLKKKGRQGHE